MYFFFNLRDKLRNKLHVLTKKKFFFSRTNILGRYLNKDFTLTLPDNKKITDIKWFAIYDLSSQVYTYHIFNIKYSFYIYYFFLLFYINALLNTC